jgi:hypothetical protein
VCDASGEMTILAVVKISTSGVGYCAEGGVEVQGKWDSCLNVGATTTHVFRRWS